MAKNNPPDTPPRADAGDSDWVTVGHVVGVFGVHGEIKVEPYTSFPERFAETGTVYAGTTHTPYRILGAHPHKHHILLQLEGIPDIGTAERLRGVTLAIPAGEIRQLPQDHYYLHDIIGLEVREVNGRKLGTIKDVLVTGGTDLFVIERAELGPDVLVPAVKEFIKSIDMSAGVVELDPIPGLFDDNFDSAI